MQLDNSAHVFECFLPDLTEDGVTKSAKARVKELANMRASKKAKPLNDPCRVTICFLRYVHGDHAKIKDSKPQDYFEDKAAMIMRQIKGLFYLEEYHVVCESIVKCPGEVTSAMVRVERYEPCEQEIRLDAVGIQSQWNDREEEKRAPRQRQRVDLNEMKANVVLGPRTPLG